MATVKTDPDTPRARRRQKRRDEQLRRQAEEAAKLASLPVHNRHAAGIDVGDRSHWVCFEATPDASDTVREFPAHTPGLRQLVAWLTLCGVTTIALEATGVYAHVLFLTLLEAGSRPTPGGDEEGRAPMREAGPLAYSRPAGARVALLQSPILPTARPTIPRRGRTVQPRITRGGGHPYRGEKQTFLMGGDSKDVDLRAPGSDTILTI